MSNIKMFRLRGYLLVGGSVLFLGCLTGGAVISSFAKAALLGAAITALGALE